MAQWRFAPYSQETNPILPMDKTKSQVATITSSVWNTPAASSPPNGVLPPSPTTLRVDAIEDRTTLLQPGRSARREAQYQLWRIQSNREPYSSEYMVTPYGGMETRMGTNLGIR